jgi:hypothetical protein
MLELYNAVSDLVFFGSTRTRINVLRYNSFDVYLLYYTELFECHSHNK